VECFSTRYLLVLASEDMSYIMFTSYIHTEFKIVVGHINHFLNKFGHFQKLAKVFSPFSDHMINISYTRSIKLYKMAKNLLKFLAICTLSIPYFVLCTCMQPYVINLVYTAMCICIKLSVFSDTYIINVCLHMGTLVISP